MEYGEKQYPGFFNLHSAGFLGEEKADGKARMQQSWQHILHMLYTVLLRDPQIRPTAFTVNFTAEQFTNILFSLMLSALMQGTFDPSPVLEVIRRTVY